MSNINDENDPQSQQGDPNAERSIPDTIAARLGAPPRLTSGDLPWQKLLTTLDQIRYLNDRIRINTENQAKFLSSHMRDLDRTKGLQQDIRQQEERFNQIDRRQSYASPSDLILPEMRQRYQSNLESLAGASESEQIAAFKRLGLMNEQGILSTRNIDPQQAQQALKELQGGQVTEMSKIFARELQDALVRSTIRETDPQTLEIAKNLENINEGRGMMNNLLQGFRNAIPHFGGHGMSMPQRTGPASSRSASVIEEEMGDGTDTSEFGLGDAYAGTRLSSRLLARGVSRGGRVGALSGRLTGLLGGGRLAASALPGIGELVLGYELLRNFGRDIPIVGSGVAAANEMFGRESRLTGQLTGEERSAGIAARFDAAALTPGGRLSAVPFIGGVASTVGGLLHPWDPITNEIANQIVTSVRTAGFTGDRARDLYHSVADVYRDLGLSIDQTTKMIVEATRNGGESLNQIVREMKGFDGAAHSLSMNINEYASTVETAAEQIRGGGLRGPGQTTATALAQALVAALPRSMRNEQGVQTIQQVRQNLEPLIAAQMGVPQQYLQLPQYAGRAQAAFTSTIAGLVAQMPGRNIEEQIANATRLPMLQGLNVTQIEQLLGRSRRSRGAQAQGVFNQALTDYSRRLGSTLPMVNRNVDDLTEAERRARGIHTEYRVLPGRSAVSLPVYLDSHGREVKTVRMRGDVEDMPPAQLRRIRNQTIDTLARGHLLTRAQEAQLRKIARTGEGHFADRIRAITGQKGPMRDAFNTPFGTIKVVAGQGLKNIVNFKLSQRQAQSGKIPFNQMFAYEEQRNSPTITGN